MHRDACHDQQQQFTVDWQVCVYFGRPRPTSKLIASRGGVWKYANAQWAFYPNGGGISTRGAVTPAWFYNRPFIRLTLMPVTQSLGNSYLFPKRVLNHGESSEEVPQFLWLFSQPFLLERNQSSTLNLSPLLTGTPPVSTECRNRMSPIRARPRLISLSQCTAGATPRTSRTSTPRSFSTMRRGSIPRASC